MHHSLTYQYLPPWLLQPLLAGVLSQPEAAEIWDGWLMTPPNERRDLPPHLYPACQRLHLWEEEPFSSLRQ